MIKKKNGNAFLDGTTIAIIGFIISLCVYFVMIVVDPMRDSFLAEDQIANTQAADIIQTGSSNVINALDYMFFTFIILSWAVAICLSIMVETSPIWLWLTIALSMITFGLAYALQLAFVDFTSAEQVAIYQATFPITNFVMTHFLKVVIVFYFTIVLAQFGKRVFQ